ncbi:hypothetical protein PR048_007538 [Dryococelus australis]|uniref:Uncharacterized protein n=1 Tax=Dryococelus australis TaxID=614101 RepID=A0ABQ9HUY3_9NEOP|nr:hypothetical protein PR048_007538 [Dryococelus australis]
MKYDQDNWDKWVPYTVFVFNTTPHSSAGFAPHELLYGIKPNLPGILRRAPSTEYQEYDYYVRTLRTRLQQGYQVARERQVETKLSSKAYYDKTAREHVFNAGDSALLCDETVRRGRFKKLSNQWVGPYTIVKVGGVNCTLHIKGNKVIR